ncbi:hypothetical protein GWI33_006887 [Rhynchophorus ferrugineus]|uniref:Transposase n=1 Tax=Rhynchophorus ferrugineus TaxID=354439 RepID=A0A834IKF0_RHYFE|nr:hypothetical protein GWI33_006887 [Rhynchophorus ferrugineus]
MSTEDGQRNGRTKEFTFDQKQRRVHAPEKCLKMIKRNKPEFLRRYVAMDETWLHYFTLKFNRQSSEWTTQDEPVPKRGKKQQSAGKVMASVFWDAHGIIFIDYLEIGSVFGPFKGRHRQKAAFEEKDNAPKESKPITINSDRLKPDVPLRKLNNRTIMVFCFKTNLPHAPHGPPDRVVASSPHPNGGSANVKRAGNEQGFLSQLPPE